MDSYIKTNIDQDSEAAKVYNDNSVMLPNSGVSTHTFYYCREFLHNLVKFNK